MYLKNFDIYTLKYTKISFFKKAKVKLDLLTDTDMLIMVENRY